MADSQADESSYIDKKSYFLQSPVAGFDPYFRRRHEIFCVWNNKNRAFESALIYVRPTAELFCHGKATMCPIGTVRFLRK